MIGAGCDAYDRVVIAALCSPAGRFALSADVAAVRRDLAVEPEAALSPASRPGDALLARIEEWCEGNDVSEVELGRAAASFPGFVGLLRKRGSIGPVASRVEAFLDAHPHGVADPAAGTPPAIVVAGAPVERERKPAFRSWAEDFDHRAAATVAVDRQAFANRSRQRAQTARNADSSTPWKRSVADGQEAERAAAERRQTVPVEKARLFLQRRNVVICRADVVGRRADRWAVSGRREDLDDAQLIELAQAKGFAE